MGLGVSEGWKKPSNRATENRVQGTTTNQATEPQRTEYRELLLGGGVGLSVGSGSPGLCLGQKIPQIGQIGQCSLTRLVTPEESADYVTSMMRYNEVGILGTRLIGTEICE